MIAKHFECKSCTFVLPNVMVQPRLFSLFALLGSWLVGLLAFLLYQPLYPDLDHDEVYWVGSTYYYDLAFVQRDWVHPAWQLLPARENPPVSKYVLGFGLAAAGHRITTLDSLSYFYLFWLRLENNPEVTGAGQTPDYQKRFHVLDAATPGFRESVVERKRSPLTKPIIQAARATSTLCVVLASLLLLLLVSRAGDWIAGLIAGLLLLLHPLVLAASGRAMSDSVALLFSIAAAFAVLSWYRCVSAPPPSRFRGAMGRSLTAGLFLALACGAKMNSLILVLVAGVIVALVAGRDILRKDRLAALQVVAHGLLILAVGVVVFVVINPTLMQDPVGGMAATVLEHRRTEALHTDLTNSRLEALPAKVSAVVKMGFVGWIPFVALVLGTAWFVIRQWHDAAVRFAAVWWVVAFVCLALWVPFVWPRYIIPILPPSTWLIACMVSAGLRRVVPHFRNAGVLPR
jgi:hypothetical protein